MRHLKRKLPIGEASFSEIRKLGCYYVDKTPHVQKLIDDGKYWFLSRPRRFGKSLLVSTLKELFEGNEKLFQGLHIHDQWDWNTKYPVIRLSFDAEYGEPDLLHNEFYDQLDILERVADIDSALPVRTAPGRLRNLIFELHRRTGQQIVLLVDEYDKPILDSLDNPKQAVANRNYLRALYGMIKGCAEQIRFVFITGISMYSKVSLFSGMNILQDISLDPEYATVCGYTETDIDTVFAPELDGLDRGEMQRWYNGYDWLGAEKVYNPHSILQLFRLRRFEPHWYRTGTPSYLYRMMVEGKIITLQLSDLEMLEEELSSFELEQVNLNALLFQCGYLTIVDHEVRSNGVYYRLDYPNHEVRLSLNRELLRVAGLSLIRTEKLGDLMARQLADNDFAAFETELRAFYAGVPNEFYHHGDVAGHEGHYLSLLYACFTPSGLTMRVQESTAQGRSDLVVLHAEQVFVLGFKMVADGNLEKAANKGMRQILDQGYAEKYRTGRQQVHLLLVACKRLKRNLVEVKMQKTCMN